MMLINKFNLDASYGESLASFDKLNPWFVTGFYDAESCFNITVSKSSSCNLGFRVQMRLIIELHTKDIHLLYKIQSFFKGISVVSKHNTRNSVRYSIVKFNDLFNIIVPHFVKYPLQSSKKHNFDLWKDCAYMVYRKEHLTLKGLKKIVFNKKCMRGEPPSGSIKVFPTPNYYNKKDLDSSILDPYWISGFVEGDGSFFIFFNENKKYVNFRLSIHLHNKEEFLLKKIQHYFGGLGTIYIKKNSVEWKVLKISELQLIVSNFDNYSFKGLKGYNYNLWKEIFYLKQAKAHLTIDGLKKIKLLKNKLNKWD